MPRSTKCPKTESGRHDWRAGPHMANCAACHEFVWIKTVDPLPEIPPDELIDLNDRIIDLQEQATTTQKEGNR